MISVVVPLYNEAQSLATLHAELARTFESQGLGAAEFLFVDDGSRDGSWAVIRAMATADPRVRGIRFRRNFGKAAALTAGFRASRGSIVFTLDGDLQDDPAEIPRFLAKLEEGETFDVVSGWKRTRHDPWHKVGPSRIFNRMVSALTGCKLHDHNCGFKVYRREVLDEVTLYGELHRFVPVLAQERGFRVTEVVVNHRARKFGHSKYGFARFIKGLLDLLTVHFLSRYGQRPLHVLGAIGLAMLAMGGLGMTYLAVIWVIGYWVQGYRPIGDRPLMFYSGTLLGVGTQLLCMGILAEMVTAYSIRESDTFSVAETLGSISDERSQISENEKSSEGGSQISGDDNSRTHMTP